MSEKLRLSNDTVVDLDRLSEEELFNLISERQGTLQIQQLPERREAQQGDIDKFMGVLAARHLIASPECGESE